MILPPILMKRKSSHQEHYHAPVSVDDEEQKCACQETHKEQPCLVTMMYVDLKQLVRDRFLDDQKSLTSKMRVREAIAKILAELDQEIAQD
jgi:hypothetical protein